jgi:hypothetical protein
MSYTALMDKQLLKAFKLCKDLAIDATFTKKNKPTFNFGTGKVAATTDIPKIVQLIQVDREKTKKESTTSKRTMIARAADLGDLNSYDVLEFDSATWKIGDVIKGVGLIYMFEVIRNG